MNQSDMVFALVLQGTLQIYRLVTQVALQKERYGW